MLFGGISNCLFTLIVVGPPFAAIFASQYFLTFQNWLKSITMYNSRRIHKVEAYDR